MSALSCPELHEVPAACKAPAACGRGFGHTEHPPEVEAAAAAGSHVAGGSVHLLDGRHELALCSAQQAEKKAESPAERKAENVDDVVLTCEPYLQAYPYQGPPQKAQTTHSTHPRTHQGRGCH